MQRMGSFVHCLRLALWAGLVFVPMNVFAAEPAPTPDPSAFAEAEIEIIPPPPGLTRSAQADPAAVAETKSAKGLALPEQLSLPPAVSKTGLSAPGYLTAIAGNRSVLLSWYLSEGPKAISGYLVYRGLSADAIPPQPINLPPITETNFSDSELNSTSGPLNRSTYYYKVRAFDVEGRLSPYSDVAAATPSGPLLPPGKLSAAGYDGKVVLQWSAPISTGEGELASLRLLRGELSGALGPYRDLPAAASTFSDEGLPNGKPFYYAVQSIDSLGNSSAPSAEARGVAFRPLSAPQGLSALGVGDEAVRLKWSAPAEGGTFRVKGYNVYRSSGGPVDLASAPINKALIAGSRTRFEDGPDDSLVAPRKGVDYRYVVVAVDEDGNPSPPSVASVAGPVASITKLETGEIEVTRGNTLQISGRKTIDVGNTWIVQDEKAPATGAPSTFALDQQLQVRLTGKVGRKIKVDVDYDDKQVGNQQQKISVVYSGDQQEVFKEFAFGDILMDLSSNRTEFAGYNKSLFGAKLTLVSPDERLKITAVGAQTKGITETKRIVGGYEQARTGNVLGENKQDLSFTPYRFYYLSRDKDLVEGPDYVIPGSVEIWRDVPGSTIYNTSRREVADKFGTGRFNFVRMQPNVEYTVDNSTGMIKFLAYIGQRDNIAVAYRVQRSDGSQVSVGYDSSGSFDFTPANMDSDKDTGKTSDSKKLIQYGNAYVTQYDSHMSMQFYQLGGRDILNPQLDKDFKLVIYTANQSVFYQLDPNSNFSDVVDFDTRQGWMKFRVPFPFRAGTASADQLRMDSGYTAVEQVFSGEQNDAYNTGPNRINNFTVHIEYKYKVPNYTLHYNIIRASEVIVLDGRRLARDVDYFLDYDTGTLVFSNPDMIKESSVVDATYEYLPFGGQFTSTIWGTRGEYAITKDISVGTTFLWNTADAPNEVPDVRSSPYSLQILDGDLQVNVPQDLIDGLTRKLPLLPERGGLLAVKGRGELAHSWFRPNTYGRNNESGVAMIDSFEAVDNLVSTSVDRTSWFPSSRPLRFTGDSGVAASDRVFTRFTTVSEKASNASTLASGENPNRSMAKIEWASFSDANKWDSYVYSFGQSTPQAIQSASFLTVIVKSSTTVTLHVDAGIVSEDATDNGILDTESATGILSKDKDIGFYTNQTPRGSFPYPDPISSPGSYLDPNYWGNGNKVLDTEDLDGSAQLDTANNYYTFSAVVTGDGNWQTINIPLTSASVIGTDLSVVPGNSRYFANVRHVRVWIDGSASQGGAMTIESIQFKGSKWQVRADPNVTTLGGISVTADTNRFQVSAVSGINNTGAGKLFTYVPNTTFFNKETNSSDAREQSLQLEYALTRLEQENGKPYFQARKQLANGQDVDVGVYQKLRVDVYKPHVTLPGERLLVRLGSDDQNYFEYQVPLDSLMVGAWNSVSLSLDGGDGSRSTVGRPYMRQVRYVTLAIHTLNDNLNTIETRLQDDKEVIWLDNLRLTDAILREGGAQRVGVTYDLMGGALVVTHDIRDVDSDFVKMDQQAIDPVRHDRSQIVDARLNAIQGVPLSARYESRERFSERERRADPKYNRVFVDPDESSQRTSANLGFSRWQGISANSAVVTEHKREIFLPAYIETQRNLAQEADKGILPNTNRDDLHLNQDLTLKAPAGWWGIRNDELKLEATFIENKVLFDREAVLNQAFKNVERRSRTMKGRYSGSYKAGGWMTLSPSYAYTLTEAEGSIANPTLINGLGYYQLDQNLRSNGWVLQSRVINPSLQLQFSDASVLRNPRITYNFTQTRDYVRNELRSPGSLDLGTSLNLASLGGSWAKVPALELTQSFAVDSMVNNDLRVRGSVRDADLTKWRSANPDFSQRYAAANQSIPSIALQEQQSPFQSTWWVRLEDFGLGENVKDPLHIENVAVTSNKRNNTSFSTRFDLPLLPNWTGAFTPRISLVDQRQMSAPEQVVHSNQMTLGSGLDFRDPHILFYRTLKPSNLTLDYSYSTSDNYTVNLLREDLTSNSVRHTFSSTLPMRPSEAMALTAGLRWSGTGESSYLAGSRDPSSKRGSSQLDPSIKLVYFLKIDKIMSMPDMWPFNGRKLQIRQNFRLDNDLSASFRSDSQSNFTNTLADTSSDTYELSNQLGYDVLDNVKMNFSIVQKLFNSHNSSDDVRSSSYYSITLKLGLEAVF